MKNLSKILTLSTLVCAIFVGCSPKTPNCSAEETKDLVLNIINDEMKKQLGEEAASKVSFSLDTIRTIKHNKEIDKYKCVAKLITTNKENGSMHEADIEYDVEQTDDHRLYVSVYGL